jgi:hypothetical protein
MPITLRFPNERVQGRPPIERQEVQRTVQVRNRWNGLRPVLNKAAGAIIFFSVAYGVITSVINYAKTTEKLATHVGIGQAVLAHIGLIAFGTVLGSFAMILLSGVSFAVVRLIVFVYENVTKPTRVPTYTYLLSFVPAAVGCSLGQGILWGILAYAVISVACLLVAAISGTSRFYPALLVTGSVAAGFCIMVVGDVTDSADASLRPGGHYDSWFVWIGAALVGLLVYLIVHQAKIVPKRF